MSDNNKQELRRFPTWNLEEHIKYQDTATRERLKQIEQDFKRQLQTNIETARSMERLAIQEGRIREAVHYQAMAQIYQQLLDNYSLSNSYDTP
jgi:TPP-dependent pyruvate/acetoin dehydrogenase alpha subunit